MATRTRIGVLTGGGDCPGLNTVIATVVQTAARLGWETVGFVGGFEGLLAPPQHRVLHPEHLEAVRFGGGTILKTSNRGRFSAKVGHGEGVRIDPALLDEAKGTIESLGLRALVCIGGDGSLSIAQQLFERGVPLVGVPKTIDNDLDATAMTFGFDTAVAAATDALDRLRTTAASHDRVMVLEVMGRYAGWIAVYAGIAGGADIILIPEIPFDYDRVCQAIDDRARAGVGYALIVVAEGATERGGAYVQAADQPADREARLGGIAARVAREVARRTGKETRECVLGHLQRGGTPTNFDRALCTLFGTKAVELVADGCYGQMASFAPPLMKAVPIADAVGRLRRVDLQGNLVRSARALGISLGD